MSTEETTAILVVDDEDAVRRVIQRMLQSRGYNVEAVAGVDEALEMLAGRSYDILLTDHMMDGRTGLDLIVETNELYPDIVKILLTGFGDRELYRDAINKGAVFSVIEKPSDTEGLISTVDKAVKYRKHRMHEREEYSKLREQYHTIFENTTDLIQCFDTGGRLIYVNPAWHAVLGYGEDDIRDITLFDLIPGNHAVLIREIADTLQAGKTVEPFETVMTAKDNREVFIEGSATGQYKEKELLTVTFILRDVTERKRAAEEIQARLRQETMIARLADMFARTDEPRIMYDDVLENIGSTVYADRAYLYAFNEVDKVFSKIAVWQSPELETPPVVFPEIPFAEVPWAQKKILDDGSIFSNKPEDVPESDRKIFKSLGIQSILVLPIKISTCVVGVLGLDTHVESRTWDKNEITMLEAASDIIANAWTRQIEIEVRKQKEFEAEQSRMLVIRADRLAALGTMAAGIIHEITQPLNAINVSAQTIQYGKSRGWTLESEQVGKSLDLIVDQIKRMSDIITNMRAFARDGLSAPKQNENLNRQIERVFTMLGEQMKAHDIGLVFTYGDIPDIIMNTHQILQVILNLVTNARQALDESDSTDKQIDIVTWCDDTDVYLEVADNGPGVSENIHEKIFDPFYTTKEVGKGTGLGLSISAGIVHDHGGDLIVRTNDNGGATFVLKLPIEEMDAGDK